MFQKLWFRNVVIGSIVAIALYLIYATSSVLAPVFIALAIAYVLDPVIDRFERWNISRTWGIIWLCLLLAMVLTGLSLYLVPLLILQLHAVADAIPIYWERALASFKPFLKEYIDTHPSVIEEAKVSILSWLKENAAMLSRNLLAGLATSFKSIGNFFGNLLGVVIIPVFAFYFLRDFDLFMESLARLIPIKHRNWTLSLAQELNTAMRNFIKSQLLVATLLAVIYTIGLWICGCPGFLLIGVIAGFANLIPYLGLALGLLPAVLLTYLSGNPTWQIIGAGLTFVVGQMLEGMVITPKVVGESVGLHPAVVLIGLTLGGTYFGFVGMLLAVPGTAVLMVLVRRAQGLYLNSMLYHDGLPEVADPAPNPLNEESSKPSPTPTKPTESTTAKRRGRRRL